MRDEYRPARSEAKHRPRPMRNGANWRDQAACRHVDPDLFFPVGTTGLTMHQVDEAKRICEACPSRTPCLAWALTHNVACGIWGGTTEDERRAISRAVIRQRYQA